MNSEQVTAQYGHLTLFTHTVGLETVSEPLVFVNTFN